MKKVYVLLLTILLVLTACGDRAKTKDVSVEDVRCPYKIDHKRDGAEITLRSGEKVLWQVNAMPEDVCTVVQVKSEQQNTSCYWITGKEAGAAQLTFAAQQEDGIVVFDLTLLVSVKANGQVVVSSYQHRERTDAIVQTDDLTYEWDVDLNGDLNFSLHNDEDKWRSSLDSEDVIRLANTMSVPGGYTLTAQANAVGEAKVLLTGIKTQRQIQIVIQVDDTGKMQVTSVQEQ